MNREELILKKLQGQLSDAEVKQFDSLMSEDTTFANQYQDYQLIWDTAPAASDSSHKDTSGIDNSWKQFERLRDEQPARIVKMPVWKSLSRVAAVAIIIFSAVFLYRSFNGKDFETGITCETEKGNETLFTMPDGSEIFLNENTRLEVDKNYNRETRTTRLNGTAFFVVKPDKDRVFEVVTDHLRTVVKGTTFLIRTDDHSTTVGVRTGVVEVQVGNQTETLKAGDEITVSTASGGMIERSETNQVAIDRLLSSTVRFKDATLRSIIKQTEKIYSVQITAPDKLLNNRYNLDLEGVSAEEALSVIATLTQTTVSRNGDYFELKQ
ncbi:MAG: DUF4974 domain-containing protein [Bacteroidetes bacterium]|nr:DUF4974 domain-containing protein [Bacteroidota bacterium]